MAYQLILSTDTLDMGRIKINDFFINNSNLLSAGTGAYGLLTVGGTNINDGDYALVSGKEQYLVAGAYGSILGGNKNKVQNNFASVLGGYKNTALTIYSVVVGGSNNQIRTGNRSSILSGNLNKCYHNYSVILGGSNNKAGYVAGTPYGNKSLLGGFTNKIYGGDTGFVTVNANYSAILWGKTNRIWQDYCFIGGGRNNNITQKHGTISGGRYNSITAAYGSILGGTGNRVAHAGSVVLGVGGLTRGPNSFIFSNGGTTITPAVTNNRFRIDATGAATMNGALTQNGTADYAEYFEWEDKNLNNEERVGFFVSLYQDKIKIDNSNVIGIVSATPSVIGDGAEEFWSKLHKRDIWGKEIYENFSGFTLSNSKDNNDIYFLSPQDKIYKEPPSGGNIKGILDESIKIEHLNLNNLISILKINVYNHEFDSTLEYIPRSERKEWSPIGLLGKLLVRTSENINSTRVDAGPDGKAKNGTKYHVLKTIKDFDGDYGIIQILFK